MKLLRPEADPDAFFTRLAHAPGRLLMLDYDGTLAPFTARRDEAVPYPGVREALERLIGAGHTRVVLISGRVAEEVRTLAGLQPHPEIWGTHGWERLHPDGRYELTPLGEAAATGLEQAHQAVADRPAEQVERKPASLAFHTRALAEVEQAPALEAVRSAWASLAEAHGLELHAFDGGLELRAPGISKGTAVQSLVGDMPAQTVYAYLGDDRTDEDAFGALGPGGLGVLVRERLRETAAGLWLVPPQEVLDFFERWMAACRTSRATTNRTSA